MLPFASVFEDTWFETFDVCASTYCQSNNHQKTLEIEQRRHYLQLLFSDLKLKFLNYLLTQSLL